MSSTIPSTDYIFARLQEARSQHPQQAVGRTLPSWIEGYRPAAQQTADIPEPLRSLAQRLGQLRKEEWERMMEVVCCHRGPKLQSVLGFDDNRLQALKVWFSEDTRLTPLSLLGTFTEDEQLLMLPKDFDTLLPGQSRQPAAHEVTRPKEPWEENWADDAEQDDSYYDDPEEFLLRAEDGSAQGGTLGAHHHSLANCTSHIPRGLWDYPKVYTTNVVEGGEVLLGRQKKIEAQVRTLELTLLHRWLGQLLGDIEEIRVTAVWGVLRLWTPELDINVARPVDQTPLPPAVRHVQDLATELRLHRPLAPWDEMIVAQNQPLQVLTKPRMEPRWMGAELASFAPDLA